jgi:glycosyltransferase involved in cell wall biosynthesis
MKPKLCFVVSSPITAVAFLNGHIEFLSSEYEVTVACNFDGSEKNISEKALIKNIRIERSLSPFSDVKAIYHLTNYLVKGDFQIVHSVTPKAGLVAAIAGWIARTPFRVHWFTGQVWVLKSGIQRVVLKLLDRTIGILNTSSLVDSHSQRDFLMSQRVLSAKKSQVLGFGSIAGVDAQRFRPNQEAKVRIRAAMGIENPDALLILFVGRLNRDKGIDILLQAFNRPDVPKEWYLILVGPDEECYIPRIPKVLGRNIDRFRHFNAVPNPEDFMAACDVFCLPSLREGFGLVLIEAAAAGLPVVASRIYGIVDAVEEGETGLLFAPGSAEDLIVQLETALMDPILRADYGHRARENAISIWGQSEIQLELLNFYMQHMSTKSRGDR